MDNTAHDPFRTHPSNHQPWNPGSYAQAASSTGSTPFIIGFTGFDDADYPVSAETAALLNTPFSHDFTYQSDRISAGNQALGMGGTGLGMEPGTDMGGNTSIWESQHSQADDTATDAMVGSRLSFGLRTSSWLVGHMDSLRARERAAPKLSRYWATNILEKTRFYSKTVPLLSRPHLWRTFSHCTSSTISPHA